MNTSSTRPSNAASADGDLAEQARPGYGIPSQDPRPAAQVPLQPEEAEREAKSVFVGGGMMAGAAAGATIGVVAGGPVVWWWVARWVPLPAHWVAKPLAPWSTQTIRVASSDLSMSGWRARPLEVRAVRQSIGYEPATGGAVVAARQGIRVRCSLGPDPGAPP